MAFDVEGAKKAGYTESDIADYLASAKGFDIKAAREAGHSDGELVDFLSSSEAPTPSQPQEQGFLGTIKGNLTKAGLLAPEGGFTPEQQQQRLETLGKAAVSAPVGIAKGAVVDPLVGMAQMGAHVTGYGEEADKLVKQYKDAVAPFKNTAAELMGGVVSPVNKLFGPMEGMSKLKTVVKSASAAAALATLQPTESENFWTDKSFNALMGAAIGGAIPISAYGLKALKDIYAHVNFSKTGRLDALRKEILEKIPQDDLNTILTAARKGDTELVAGSKPTVGQMLADTPQAANVVKMEADLARQQSVAPAFAQRLAEQQAARQGAVAGVGGGQAAVAGAQAGQQAALAQKTAALGRAEAAGGQLRQTFTTIENTLKQEADDLVKANKDLFPQLDDERFADILPATSASIKDLVSQRANALKSLQVKSLNQSGIFPLFADDIVTKIDKAIKLTKEDTTKAVLKHLRDKIISKTDKNGIINSTDLYVNVRKTTNDEIAKLLGIDSMSGLPAQAAGALNKAKSFVDDALNKSSSGLWGSYLKDYAKHSQKLDQIKIGESLSEKLNTALDAESAASFAQAVRDSASIIKKSTGFPRYTQLEQVLSPKDIAVLKNVTADLQRASQMKRVSGRVAAPVQGATAPQVFERTYTLIKGLYTALEKGNRKTADAYASQIFLGSGDDFAKFLEGVPKGKIKQVTNAIMKGVSPEVAQAILARMGSGVVAASDELTQ